MSFLSCLTAQFPSTFLLPSRSRMTLLIISLDAITWHLGDCTHLRCIFLISSSSTDLYLAYTFLCSVFTEISAIIYDGGWCTPKIHSKDTEDDPYSITSQMHPPVPPANHTRPFGRITVISAGYAQAHRSANVASSLSLTRHAASHEREKP